METMAHVRIQGSCDRRRIGRSIQYHICLPLIVSSGASSQSVVRIYSLATADAHAIPMWHHKSVIALFHIVLRLLIDLIALTALGLRQRRATAAEILVLRRQIALYQERGIKPRRIDPVTRISLALLSRFFNWRDALVVVRPETMRRWHRAGWKLFWRLKSRPGRPRGDLRWSTFLRLHAQGIIACDFLIAVTATFRLLYVFVVSEHRSRRLIHCNITAHPSAT